MTLQIITSIKRIVKSLLVKQVSTEKVMDVVMEEIASGPKLSEDIMERFDRMPVDYHSLIPAKNYLSTVKLYHVLNSMYKRNLIHKKTGVDPSTGKSRFFWSKVDDSL